eukprot:s62_g10.t1
MSIEYREFRVALDAFSKTSQWQSAQEMVTLGLEGLANGARNGKHRLEVDSLEPSLKIYNSFIASCARVFHWLRALQTLRKLKLG